MQSQRDLTVAGPVELLLQGRAAAQGFTNQQVLRANSLSGDLNIYSNFFALDRTDPGTYSASLLSFGEIQANLFGDGQSINMLNGARYADNLAGTSVSSDLVNYYLRLQDRSLSPSDKSVAIRQLYGEYAPAIAETLKSDRRQFRKRITSRIDRQDAARRTAALARPGSGTAYASLGSVSPEAASRVWGGGFGNWSKQDGDDRLFGYDYDAYGAALGYDRELGDAVTLGMAAAYAKGKIDVDRLLTEADTRTVTVGLYGEYRLESGLFARAGAGYGHGWNDYHTTMIVGGGKSGSFSTDVYFADVSLGYSLDLSHGISVTPSAGLDYSHFRTQSWLESLHGAGLIQQRFAATSANSLDIPLGLAVDKRWQTGSDGFVQVKARAALIHAASGNRTRVNTGFAGTSAEFALYGMDPGKNRWQFGAELEYRMNERFDFGFAYDFEFQSRYQSHSLSANMGLRF